MVAKSQIEGPFFFWGVLLDNSQTGDVVWYEVLGG
jgi:hypothetical protein